MAKAKTPEEKKAIAIKAAATRSANKAKKIEALQPKEAEATPEERVVKADMEPAEAEHEPAFNNNNEQKVMNKPIGEYNATDTRPIVRREATPEEEAAQVGEEEEPRHLVIGEGPGNLSIIKWNRGGGQIPKNCWGGWNNKARAQEAIKAAHSARDYDDLQATG